MNKSIEAKNEHIQKSLDCNRDLIRIVAAEQEKKLSDYIVESFVRFNELENKVEEVINFVNNMSKARNVDLKAKPNNPAAVDTNRHRT